MQRRALLRQQLIEAWHYTINNSYRSQLINSERGLQIYFCAALMNLFRQAKLERRVFIEPHITSKRAGKSRYPDVVICNSQRIIGVVELKYLPRVRAKFAKDIETLEFFSKNHSDFKISNDRYRGITGDNRIYPLAKDAVLCWAGVYTGKRIDLKLHVCRLTKPKLLQLDATTSKGHDPSVFPEFH